jgi:hypothetical protein
MQTVRIVQVEPYHKVYGLLTPLLAQRLSEGFAALGDEDSIVLPQFMSRLWAKDPGTLLLAAIDSTGTIKGHTAAVYQKAGTEAPQVIFIQPRLDEPTENDAVAEMIEWIERWAKSLGATSLVLLARRVDAKWIKKHSFEVSRYILTREVK